MQQINNYTEVLLGTFLVFSPFLSGWTFIFLGAAMAVESSFTSEGTTDVRFVLFPSSTAGKMAWILLFKRALTYKVQVKLPTLLHSRSL